MGVMYLICCTHVVLCALVVLHPANLVSLAASLAAVVVVLHVVDDLIGHSPHQVTQESAAAPATAVISVEHRQNHPQGESS